MTLTALDQELINLGAFAEQTAATLVAAKNPAYAGVISTLTQTTQAIAAAANPTGSAQATQLSGDVVAAIQPATTAVNALVSKTSTPTQKASGIVALLGLGEELIPETITFFEGLFAKKPTTPAAS